MKREICMVARREEAASHVAEILTARRMAGRPCGTERRRVELLAGDDFLCVLLGSLGFSTKYIMSRTDLSPAQVAYRLRCGQVRRADYRNGESAVAASVLERARHLAVPAVTRELRKVHRKSLYEQ